MKHQSARSLTSRWRRRGCAAMKPRSVGKLRDELLKVSSKNRRAAQLPLWVASADLRDINPIGPGGRSA